MTVELNNFERHIVLRLITMEDYGQITALQQRCFQGLWKTTISHKCLVPLHVHRRHRSAG